jgi:hypothetical protein
MPPEYMRLGSMFHDFFFDIVFGAQRFACGERENGYSWMLFAQISSCSVHARLLAATTAPDARLCSLKCGTASISAKVRAG